MSDQPLPLFRYVPLADYKAPPWPATENVRRGLRALWRSLGRSTADETPAVAPKTLTRLSGPLLEGVACPQPNEVLSEALGAALDSRVNPEGGNGPVRVVVSAAHCSTPAALHGWASRPGWKIIEPPTMEQILAGGEDWLAGLGQLGDTDCGLPHLERCFLRHAEGLNLVRRLISWLLAREGRCLVGCNDFGWAYLGAALGVDAVFPPPLTLAPFNAEALAQWFRKLLASGQGGKPVFRNAVNGRLVLPENGMTKRSTDDAEKLDEYLTHLAAGSRGIAAVAWAIWRYSLRVSAPADTTDKARAKAGEDSRTTIWVKPWADLELPSPLPQARQSHRFILHALLIHGGLTEAAVDLLVPISGAVLHQSLRVLAAEGLIEQVAGRWQVTPCAYPAVRQSLVNEEYLVGAL